MYEFSDFIARMAKLDYPDILQQAIAECRKVEASSYSVKGAPREMGSTTYAAEIRAFLWFMQQGTRPASANDHDFAPRHFQQPKLE